VSQIWGERGRGILWVAGGGCWDWGVRSVGKREKKEAIRSPEPPTKAPRLHQDRKRRKQGIKDKGGIFGLRTAGPFVVGEAVLLNWAFLGPNRRLLDRPNRGGNLSKGRKEEMGILMSTYYSGGR